MLCYTGRTGCVNGAVRLVNGRRASEGSVQICVDGVWGHVCGNYWYAANAKVVCRQLGYSTMCKLKDYYQKEQKQISISKKKSSLCRDGSIHECTG